ncbi:MAG TPA: hypothetical protein VH309_03345 [Elusimicrobiota bacterium]|jgi:hypothetical protein|nr:hypothetical protein [Elusimicrobiota bacterium]
MGRPGLLLAVLAGAALGACIPYPADMLPDDGGGKAQYSLVAGAYPGLDAGASEQDSLHFKVHAYGSQVAQDASSTCEQTYSRVMTDMGLYSFTPQGLYDVVIYGSQDEYRKKTGQPDWSPGVTVGRAIYTFYSPAVDGVLAHLMSHLIWYEFMSGRLSDQQRWVDEGLAVYEESKARAQGSAMYSSFAESLRSAPMPVDQLQNMAPNTERAYDASLWYAESESLIGFMIEHGGRIGFGQFLTSVQQGETFDAAIANGFPGQWQTLDAFFNAWKASLQ